MPTSWAVLFVGRDVAIFSHQDINLLAFGPEFILCFTLLRTPIPKDPEMRLSQPFFNFVLLFH